MKKLTIILGVPILSISLLLFSCDKNETNKMVCDQLADAQSPRPVIIELQDSQGRDLLNPATPGHYDTTEAKALNNPKVKVLNIGNDRYAGNKDRIRLTMFLNETISSIKLKLSGTVEDNIAGVFKTESSGCSLTQNILTFSYNGVNYPQTFDHYFIIKK